MIDGRIAGIIDGLLIAELLRRDALIRRATPTFSIWQSQSVNQSGNRSGNRSGNQSGNQSGNRRRRQSGNPPVRH
ncbi:MAG TPA: hypothetical protein VFV98_09060 [Vicinamibacterales bacterium]|nr:hypothetical protein [Vicinamibacterales bacterium]